LDPLIQILPHLSASREICHNRIDDDGNGQIDCADRTGCPEGIEGPAQEILATQCCGGRPVPLADFQTVKNCGACGISCVYPDKSGNEKFYSVGTCEKRLGSWTCVAPEDTNARQKQLLNAACYSSGTDPLSKVLETLENLQPKVPVGNGHISISVSDNCAKIYFRKHL